MAAEFGTPYKRVCSHSVAKSLKLSPAVAEDVLGTYRQLDFVAAGTKLIKEVYEMLPRIEVGAAVLCKGQVQNAQLAMVTRRDGYIEYAVGGKIKACDIGVDAVTRARSCVRREVGEELGGLTETDELFFMRKVQYLRSAKLYVIYLFLRPTAVPAFDIHLLDGQTSLQFIDVALAYRLLAQPGRHFLPSCRATLETFCQAIASSAFAAMSGVCVGCGRVGHASGGCESCGRLCVV